MEYKGFKIVEKQEGFVILDSKFNQELFCKTLQTCKIRISKLISTRKQFNI